MTDESWYTVVDAREALTQGDLIFDCPLIAWKTGAIELQGRDQQATLRAASHAIAADVVVMTQACDLAHSKVPNITLCAHWSLTQYRAAWESELRAQNQNPTPKAWRRHCEDIRDGYVWNLAMLNARDADPLKTEHRVVDFREVFTVPRSFLESFLRQRGGHRLRLLPPYREHLSQAFARFFMRVGLPTPVAAVWQA